MQIIVATITFLILDGIWLGFIANQSYIDAFGPILRMADGRIQPNLAAAAVVYVALIAGIILLVIPKAGGQLLPAFLWGAFFGFVTYATYDFTNLAVLKDWSLKMSIIDTIWGMVLCGATSFVTVWFTR